MTMEGPNLSSTESEEGQNPQKEDIEKRVPEKIPLPVVYGKLKSLVLFMLQRDSTVDSSPKKENSKDNEPHSDGNVNEPGNLNN